MSNCWASSASVLSPFTAARATFALKAGVWFRRGRLVIVSPFPQPSWPLSGRNSTQRACPDSPNQLCHARGLPARGWDLPTPGARFGELAKLPESAKLGELLNKAMALIEEHNRDLAGVLPRSYLSVEKKTLVELLRLLAPVDIEGDAFGRVYEYFMGEFAKQVMQKGGEFYTPASIVKLIVE